MNIARSVPPPQIETAILKATQRRNSTLILGQSALSLALIFGGIILMLLLGTEILSGFWLLLLGAIGIAIAAQRIIRNRITAYRVAQLLDLRFGLSDALSTAWFLRTAPEARDDSIARFQIEHAEQVARSVRPADAFPFTGQRNWAVAGALAVIAIGLFAARYLVTDSLSLRRAFLPIQLESIFERLPDTAFADAQRKLNAPASDQNSSLLSSAAHESTPPSDVPPALDGKESAAGSAEKGNSPSPNANPQEGKKGSDGSSQAQEGGKPGNDAKAGSKSDESAQSPGSPAKPDQKDEHGSSKEGSPGLMDKMKDALSGMMAKMRPGQNPQGTPQDDKHQNGEGKTGNPNSPNKEQSGQQQSAANQQAGQQQNASGQAQGETKEKAQASQGQSSDQSTESGSDSRSGVGSQDGDKGLKEASQLQAMGKLEEIIGKRSASLTGEMSVETPPGKQQLKTAYTQKQGHHADLGGEINRDQIPLIYQPYVREYMEQVRKQGANTH